MRRRPAVTTGRLHYSPIRGHPIVTEMERGLLHSSEKIVLIRPREVAFACIPDRPQSSRETGVSVQKNLEIMHGRGQLGCGCIAS
jgi:hypothetical protein